MLSYCRDYSSNWIPGWAMRRDLMFVEVAERMHALLASTEKNACPAGWLSWAQLEDEQVPAPLVAEAEGPRLPGCVGEPALANSTAGPLAVGNDKIGKPQVQGVIPGRSFSGQPSSVATCACSRKLSHTSS